MCRRSYGVKIDRRIVAVFTGFNFFSVSSLLRSKVLLFQELSLFVERCYEVIRNLIHQTSGLYQTKYKIQSIRLNFCFPESCVSFFRSKLIDIKEIRFTIVFEMLSEMLSVLITLDEIIAHNIILKEHWALYTK